jgi:serine/threonine protein kinase
MDGSESLAPGSIPVATGDVLAGKYRVDRILGIGGMGVVVAATHLQLDQKVALKFMLPQGLKHPGLVERFAREARAAVRLKSDHVARVLDVGTLDSGSPYMVMEYLEGRDLGDLVESQGPMAVPAAVDCVLQACDAVAEAHALGIVHRDLKPRNLFLTGRNDGRALVKVLDFGISKHKTGTSDLSLTRTTEVIGSPNYMSPEQLKSARGADERSDIWALGVILYELLTGQVPFLAESVTQLTAMVLTENPRSVEQLRPDVPRALAMVVACCLEKDPARRYPSVAHLAAALEPFAPPDTRDLAARIARIAGASGGTLPSQLGGSSGTRVAVSGSTAASWSGKTELATGSGKKVAAIVAVVGMLALAAGLAIFLAVRPTRTHATGLRPDPPTAAAGTSTASAAGTVVPSASTSEPVTLAPSPTTPGSTSAVATSSPTPTTGARLPLHGATTTATATPTGSTSEPPRYRTSW